MSPYVSTTRIKICGITTPDDALAVVRSGADALGLVFYAKSPRAVSIDQAQRIADVVPPFVSIVALVVDEPVEGVERILNSVPVDIIQFHGDESAQFCQQFQRPWIKALRVKPDTDVIAAAETFSAARGVLLDSFQPGIPGGTGKRFDWAQVPHDLPMPWVLAGGLLPENVAEAVVSLRPYAVDVSGGVEHSPGVKDAAKIQRFVAAVRSADQQVMDE